MTQRSKAFFLNGGAGRVLCSIPAFEKHLEEYPEDDFIIVCEGGTDFFKGHPDLYPRVYDNWHKDLFRTHIQMRDIVTTEPYRIWEYYNQKCNLSQAFDIQINDKGIRELSRPRLKLSRHESINGKFVTEEVRQVTGKEKVVVFQPFGRGSNPVGNFIIDEGGRSFEYQNMISIVRKLQKKYAVIYMGEHEINFEAEGCGKVASPRGASLRDWAGIIAEADVFLGCDSVGQHLAYTAEKPAVVVVGATCKENISYPNEPKFEVLDMGEGARIYDPIRVTMDEVTHRHNDGIMAMNSKIEDVIVESVTKMMTKYWKKKTDVIVLPNQESAAQSCGVNNVKQTLKAATEPTPADGSAIFMNPKDKPSKNGKKGFAELIETEVNK
jgi:hypothetical protein